MSENIKNAAAESAQNAAGAAEGAANPARPIMHALTTRRMFTRPK